MNALLRLEPLQEFMHEMGNYLTPLCIMGSATKDDIAKILTIHNEFAAYLSDIELAQAFNKIAKKDKLDSNDLRNLSNAYKTFVRKHFK